MLIRTIALLETPPATNYHIRTPGQDISAAQQEQRAGQPGAPRT